MPARPFLETYLYEPLSSGTKPAGMAGVPIPERRAPAYLAGQLRQILLGLMTEALEPAGLTSAQWGVIVALAKEPGIDQRRLCERCSIDPNSASRLVDELETLGLARRAPSAEDRRSNVLQLTASGRQKYLRSRPAVLAAQDRALEPLNVTEKRQFLDLLTRVVKGNQSYAKPGNGRRRPVRRTANAAVA